MMAMRSTIRLVTDAVVIAAMPLNALPLIELSRTMPRIKPVVALLSARMPLELFSSIVRLIVRFTFPLPVGLALIPPVVELLPLPVM